MSEAFPKSVSFVADNRLLSQITRVDYGSNLLTALQKLLLILPLVSSARFELIFDFCVYRWNHRIWLKLSLIYICDI